MASTSNNSSGVDGFANLSPQEQLEYMKWLMQQQQNANYASGPYTINPLHPFPIAKPKDKSYWEQMATDLATALKLANKSLGDAQTLAAKNKLDAEKYTKLLSFLLINHKDIVEEFILVEDTKKLLEVKEE